MKREIPWPYSFPIKISTAEGFKLPLKPTSKTSSTHQNGSPCMNSPKKSPPGLRTVAEGDLTLQLMRGHKQPMVPRDGLDKRARPSITKRCMLKNQDTDRWRRHERADRKNPSMDTTGFLPVASKKLNRPFVGCDSDKDAVNLALSRLRKEAS